MTQRTITALFDDYDDASKAVTKLEAAGIAHRDISIVANNAGDRHSGHARRGDAESRAGDGAGAGATVGTLVGGGAGLLAGLGLLAIPGIGPVVAAGWLVATAAGAGAGAVTGGIIGSLTGAGLSEDAAHSYAEGLRRGGTLVTARVDDPLFARAQAILDEHGSIDMDQRATTWRNEGWSGRTSPDDAPLAAHEIGSTAVGAAGSTTTGVSGSRVAGDDAGMRGIGSRDRAATLDERDAVRAPMTDKPLR